MPTQTITNNPPRSESASFGQTIRVSGRISGGQSGGAITQHGHCWALTANPTTANSKTENGAGVAGAFTSAMTGLVAETLYHTRAYATNATGTGYGDDIEFTTLPKPRIFYF